MKTSTCNDVRQKKSIIRKNKEFFALLVFRGNKTKSSFSGAVGSFFFYYSFLELGKILDQKWKIENRERITGH
jgi:hypothetical protein